VKTNIFEKAGMLGAIQCLENPPAQNNQPDQFRKWPSGKVQNIQDIEKGHYIPTPDGNGCWWMPISDLARFATAFDRDAVLKKDSKEKMLETNKTLSERALGWQVEEGKPRVFGHPGTELGMSSGIFVIEAEKPIHIIVFSNYDQGNLV